MNRRTNKPWSCAVIAGIPSGLLAGFITDIYVESFKSIAGIIIALLFGVAVGAAAYHDTKQKGK